MTISLIIYDLDLFDLWMVLDLFTIVVVNFFKELLFLRYFNFLRILAFIQTNVSLPK